MTENYWFKKADSRLHGTCLEKENRCELRKPCFPEGKLHVPEENKKKIQRNIQPPMKMDKKQQKCETKTPLFLKQHNDSKNTLCLSLCASLLQVASPLIVAGSGF
jgi:hypothetical protein